MNKKKLRAMGIMNKMISILFFMILSVSLIGCTEQQQTSLTDVVLQLKWVHQSQFAGNYAAKEKGFYEQEGLNVYLEPFSFENPTIQAVTEGTAQFGITGADELLRARIDGLPLKAIAVIYQINPVCAYSLFSSNITKPQDFIGKTVGIERASDGTDINVGILYYAMMSKLGINQSQINEITIGYDATELITGVTNVSTGYIINEPHLAIESGYPVNTILFADYGINMYADVIFTTDSLVLNNSDLCQKFLNATIRGWRYAIEHEDEAVNLVLKYAVNRTVSHEQYMLHSSIPLINNGIDPVGWMEKNKWENVQTILYDQKIISNTINIDELFTTDFILAIYGD